MTGFTMPCDVHEPGLAFQAGVGARPSVVRPALFAGSLAALTAATLAGAPRALAAPGTPTPPSGVDSAAVLAVPAAAPTAVPADVNPAAGQLAALRACESGGDYAIDTGNGYYGAYQFDLPTWQGLGFAGLPSQASAATQDAAVVTLAQRAGGWGPWPVCGRGLGAVPASAPAIVAVAPVAPDVTPQQAPTAPTAVLTLAPDAAPDAQLQAWQTRMADRGWPITADGVFGPQTQQVAAAFATEKQIVEGLPGEVGPKVWAAAWTDALTD